MMSPSRSYRLRDGGQVRRLPGHRRRIDHGPRPRRPICTLPIRRISWNTSTLPSAKPRPCRGRLKPLIAVPTRREPAARRPAWPSSTSPRCTPRLGIAPSGTAAPTGIVDPKQHTHSPHDGDRLHGPRRFQPRSGVAHRSTLRSAGGSGEPAVAAGLSGSEPHQQHLGGQGGRDRPRSTWCGPWRTPTTTRRAPT